MKIFIAIVLFFITIVCNAGTYYVSTTGNNSNPGTISQPWLTWEKAFTDAIAGDTVFFRGGVYPHPVAGGLGMWVYNSGTRANPICFFNYPGEEPILDASNINPTSGINYGIRVVGVSHINIKGLTVRNFRERYTDVLCNGIQVEGSEQIRLENITVHDIGGIGIGVYDYSDTIWIKNCDVYNVCDSLSWWPGQNGVGIQCGNMPSTYGSKVYTAVTYIEGCRVWGFSDNGFAAANGGYLEYKNCWAFDGGYLNGEGCGFKMGPGTTSVDHTTIPLQRKLTNCISAINCFYGYTDNNRGYPPMNNQYINCVAYGNGFKHCGEEVTTGYGWFNLNYLDIYPAPNWITLNCISYDNESGTPGNYYPGGTEDTFLERYNSWNNPKNVTVTDDDFISLDWTEMLNSRQADNSLPKINFMKLAAGSDLIDAGLDTLALPYRDAAPDLGWNESGSQIIADHNAVNYFDSIPDNWIDSVKKMLVYFSGRSHSDAYRSGLTLLEAIDPKYAVNVSTAESYTDDYLRSNNNPDGYVYTDVWQSWIEHPVESRPAYSTYIFDLIDEYNDDGIPFSTIAYGWCWDLTTGFPSVDYDEVTGARWFGYANGTPEGNDDLPVGLDDSDYAITGNSVSLRSYLLVVDSINKYCEANDIPTKVIYTTGPIRESDGDENNYQGYVKVKYIRDWVLADESRILFDYTDILAYDNDGTPYGGTYNDSTYQAITLTNLLPEQTGHLSNTGAIRLAKAEWWMLARIAGWDNIVTSDQEVDSTATDILNFILVDQTGTATINATNHTVAIEVEHGTGLTSLTPTITMSFGATISPTSGTARNFSSPVTYTVTALDGTTTQSWTVTVTQEEGPTPSSNNPPVHNGRWIVHEGVWVKI